MLYCISMFCEREHQQQLWNEAYFCLYSAEMVVWVHACLGNKRKIPPKAK